jgi:DNA-binding SARP family transcriptional activator
MIRFRAFGAADLQGHDGNELRALLSRPGQLALLTYLAVARPRGFHRRDTLIGLFWAETGQDHARNALRQAVHRLRHELGSDAILSRGAEELAVNSKDFWSDVGAFEDALVAGKVADALSHYRGDLLPGFFLSDTPGFEQWLEAKRAQLRDRAAGAAWGLSRAEAAGGELSMASYWARWAYALNPDDEADLRRLIDVLVRAGDHSGAIRAFEEFSERVSREYEIEPSNATRALVEPLRVHGTTPLPLVTVRKRRTEFPPYTPLVTTPATVAETRDIASAVALAPKRNWRRITAVAAIAASTLVLSAVAWRSAHTPSLRREAIAVFPFSIRGSADLAYLREGMVDLLSAKLDGAVGLRSVDPRAVLSAVRASDSLDRAQPEAIAGISRRLAAGAFVIGDVVQLAGRVNLSAAIYDVRDISHPITRVSVEGDVVALPQLVDQLAGRLLAAGTKGRDTSFARLAALTTPSLPALTAFLEGEREFRAGHAEAAREAFRAALRADSTFALAYLRLATTQGWSFVTTIDPRGLIRTARRYSSRLTPLARELMEGYDAYYRGNTTRAHEIFANLTQTYPDRVEAWFMLAETQTHLEPFLGHSPAEARPAFERVLYLDADNPHALVHLARLSASEQKIDEVRALVARYFAAYPKGDRTMEMRALRAFSTRDGNERAAVLGDVRRAGTLDWYATLSAALAYTEDVEAAASIASLAAEHGSVSPSLFDIVLSMLPLPALAAGRLTRGVPTPGTDLFDRAWPVKLRALLAVAAPVALPIANMKALRDTIASSEAHPLTSLEIFAFDSILHPQIRTYLVGVLSAKLGDRRVVDSSLAVLSGLSRRSRDSGAAADFSHLIRAEDARRRHRQADALREVEQFRLEPGDSLSYGFRPAFAHARFLRAEILYDLRRDQEALRWYSSLSEGYEPMYLPLVHFRKGEISLRRGDKAGAAVEFRRFLSLWKDCDLELKPLTDSASAALR